MVENESSNDDLYGYFYDTEVNKYIVYIPNDISNPVIYYNEYDDINYDKKRYNKNKFYKNLSFNYKFYNFEKFLVSEHYNKININTITNTTTNRKINLIIISRIIYVIIILLLSYKFWNIL